MPEPQDRESKHDERSGDSPSGENTLEQIIEQYLEKLSEGESPDQERIIQQHPALAEALRGVFRTLDFVETAGRSINASNLQRGQHLGEYRIIRQIGQGGMGIVYEAVQTSLNRRVALKILPPAATLSDTADERFTREAATAGKLHHSNIVPVYAIGEHDGIRYYAMQFIEGQTLSTHLKTMRELDTEPGSDYWNRVAQWGRQVALALAYAHEHGIIHRDIKPSNLLLDSEDNIWVSDFGLARAGAMASITLTGDLVGTARYMSPEQARGGHSQLDHRTDIYSLGTTLYELLTRSPAVEGDTRDAVLNRIAFADPKPLRQVNPAIPKDLETIVQHCMNREIEQRYQSANQVAEDLRRFLANEPILAKRTPLIVKGWRAAKRCRVQIAGVLAVALLIILTFSLSTRIRHMGGESKLKEAYRTLLYDHNPTKTNILLDESTEAGIDSADLYLCRALIPLLNAQPQRAIEPLTQALHRDPKHIETTYAMASAHFMIGNTIDALRYLERTEKKQITTALGWLLRGFALAHDRPDQTIECYDQAISIQNDFTPAIEARAIHRADMLLIAADRSLLKPMLDDFDAWVTFWPESPRSYSARATGRLFAAAYARSQPDLKDEAEIWLNGCREDLDHALQLPGVDKVRALSKYGSYLRYIGDFEGSAETFGEALEIDRRNAGNQHPGIVHHHTLALHALGQIQQAHDELTPIYEELPTFIALPLHLAVLKMELDQSVEARQLINQILTTDQSDLDTLLLTIAITLLLGDEPFAQATLAAYIDEQQESSNQPANADKINQVLAYLSGELSADALINTVEDQPGWRCQITFLTACHQLGQGKRKAGLQSLNQCLDTGVITYIHYRYAQVTQVRVSREPNWPEWVTQ